LRKEAGIVELSIVDISCVPPGATQVEALANTRQLAATADELGFSRYWVAEHHAARPQASYAPEALIPAIAAGTSRIRVGSGAVLLNHYSPFKVAETFRQLHALHPDRIDLGIGRATAGPVLDYALQRDRRENLQTGAAGDYGEQLAEVLAWLGRGFPAEHPFGRAYPLMPEVASGPPVWLLGSSPGSAAAAAELGLPYTFAAFINPGQARTALQTYRERFVPADGPGAPPRPHAMLALNAVCAETGAEASYHAMTVRGLYHRLSAGALGERHPSPEEAIAEMGPPPPPTDPEQRWSTRSLTGTPAELAELIEAMAAEVAAEEVMIQDMILDQRARLRSYELLAEAFALTGSANLPG
jgi:luciferase family oxidoreductase group 1